MDAEIRVPQLGESIVEATVARWLKAAGEEVSEGDLLVELETDKVNVEVPSTVSGRLESIAKAEGETVAVGDVLAVVNSNGASAGTTVREAVPVPEAVQPASTPQAPANEEEQDGARSTPLARRIAAEHGIDLRQVQGTGPSGRITREDVESFLQSRQAAPQNTTPASPPPAATPKPSPASQASVSAEPQSGGQEEVVRMSRRRQTIAHRLVEAQHTAAMLTTFNEIDMSAVMEMRKRRRDAFKERYGIGLGFMSFFTKAVIGGLKAFPALNAEIRGDDIIYKYYYDIGIAVGVEQGLVVPVVRNADSLTFAEIEREIARLAEKARGNQLSLADLQGGTFTITNGGTFGSLLSTPILNYPQVGILGMHKIEERPVAKNGEVVIRPMMYVALSYDHRIVDGREAVQFLVRVKELLEDPERLLLEG